MAQTKGGQEMPRGKKFTAEQIIGKLRAAELAQGKTVPVVLRNDANRCDPRQTVSVGDEGLEPPTPSV